MTALTFEQTYIKYPFAPLVTMVLNICAYFVERNRHGDRHIYLNTGTPHSA